MHTFLQDIRYALRALRRAPGFALAAVLTLGLGIGVTSAVYSIGNGVLWRPLPFPGSDRLVVLYGHRSDGSGYADLSWPDYRDVREATRGVFEDVIGYFPTPLSLAHAGSAERIWGERVSANYFGMLGLAPVLGRGFLPGEDSAGAASVAVLSEPFWRTRFHADPGILGRTVRLNGQEFTVVGVAPRGFESPYYVGFTPAVWVTAASYGLLQPGARSVETRGEATFRMLGRLRPGVTLTQANEAVAAIVRRLAEAYPATTAGLQGVALPVADARPEPEIARSFNLGMVLLLGLAGLVLVVACANVAALLLARAVARRREIAVRLALGAGRVRLVRTLMGESLVLGLAGGAAGMTLAIWITGGFTRLLQFPTDIPFVLDVALDRRVMIFTTAVTLLTAFGFGLVPALQASRPALVGALKDAGGWLGLHRSRLRNVLVAFQLAVSCVLLAGAGLVVRSLDAMRRVSLGFETRNVLLVSVSPGMAGYDSTRGRALYRDLAERVWALPGVNGASLAQFPPMEFESNGGTVLGLGQVPRPGEAGEQAGWSTVDPGYFETMRTPLLAGRGFGPGDTAGAEPVAVVSHTLAQRLWPGEDPLGHRFRRDGQGPAITVVGVAADAKYRNLAESPMPYLYLPFGQDYQPAATLVVRTTGDPLSALPAVRAAIAAIDPELPLSNVKTMDQLVRGRALLLPRLGATLTAGLATLAVALALVGLYGVVAYAVTQRTRELGIRLALGATGAGLVAHLLAEGLSLAAIGIGIGLAGSIGLGRIAGALLYGVSPLDPAVLGGTAAVLGAVTLLATWLPARRAARVDPITALRAE